MSDRDESSRAPAPVRSIFAIVSEMDAGATAAIQALWHELEVTCGMKAIKMFPLVHFTWQEAGLYDIVPLVDALEHLARITPPLVVHTGGLGIFTGDAPVIFIPLVKEPNLVRLHQEMWAQTQAFAQHNKLYYSPEMWVPHISLALKDVTRENIGRAVEQLAFRSLEMTLQINNLALVFQFGDQIGQLFRRFELQGENCP
jgi:2'-5' RNA ligase